VKSAGSTPATISDGSFTAFRREDAPRARRAGAAVTRLLEDCGERDGGRGGRRRPRRGARGRSMKSARRVEDPSTATRARVRPRRVAATPRGAPKSARGVSERLRGAPRGVRRMTRGRPARRRDPRGRRRGAAAGRVERGKKGSGGGWARAKIKFQATAGAGRTSPERPFGRATAVTAGAAAAAVMMAGMTCVLLVETTARRVVKCAPVPNREIFTRRIYISPSKRAHEQNPARADL